MGLTTLRSIVRLLKANDRSLHTSHVLSVLELKRSSYPVKYDGSPEISTKQSLLDKLRNGYKVLKTEMYKWFLEGPLQHENEILPRKDETKIIWQFNSGPEVRKKWVVTCDSDYGEGYSTAKLELSPSGTAIFSGTINTTTTKDGKTNYTGFCNMSTIPKYKAFFRRDVYDFKAYSHLVMRIRGDGRIYGIILRQKQYHDLTWNDAFQYLAYTTGGPLWQTIKIPFSKFVYCNKGTIQRHQFRAAPWVSHFGITIADGVNGDFKLEIDYIGVELVSHHFEADVYELYDFRDVMVAQ